MAENPATALRQIMEQAWPEDMRAPDWDEQWSALEAHCSEPVEVQHYRASGKQVLLGTQHICDAANDLVAQQIALALENGPVLDVSLATQELLVDFLEVMAADEDEEIPDLGDIACARCKSYCLSQKSNGEVICQGVQCPAVYESPRAAWEADRAASA